MRWPKRWGEGQHPEEDMGRGEEEGYGYGVKEIWSPDFTVPREDGWAVKKLTR